MNKKQKLQTFAYFAAALLLCGGIIALYVSRMSHSVSTFTIGAMEELSLHDLYNINGTLSHIWAHLETSGQRVRNSEPQTQLELFDEIYAQKDAGVFTGLGFLDENGFLYTAKQEVLPMQDTEYAKRIRAGKDKLVLLYTGKAFPELNNQALLFIMRIPPFKVEDTTLIAVVVVVELRLISGQLKIDSFDGQGFSTVIDSKGNFIVNIPGQGGIAGSDNMFEWFSRGTFPQGTSAGQIIEQIKKGEDGLFTYTNADGTEKMVSFMRVPDSDWSLIVNVPMSVLKKQSQGFISLALAVLCANMLLLLCLLVFFFRVRLRSINEKAQTAAKEEFLSRMRHEIRTPLNGIIGLNYLMQKSVNDPKLMEEYVEKLSHTARYLQTIVNDMLDMSQLTQDKITLDRSPFSLEHTLSAVDSLMNLHTQDKNIRFIMDASLSYPVIIGDEMRLEQVLLNVLNNAVKFTPSGGKITLRVSQSVSKNGFVDTHFEVEDTGCGMSDSFQEHIFESFRCEEGQVSPGNRGTRLGLSITALLLKKMGGDISVRSQLGHGSCFTINLPSQTASDEAEQTGTIKRKFRPGKKLNVLVAEDNELNAEILIEVLELEGHHVSWAANGKQAVDLFQASEPDEFDLVLMDLQMPVMDGYEATRRLRALNRPDAKTVPVWACTANTFTEDQKQAKTSGMTGFIPKPIDVKQLLKKLEKNA